MDGDRQVHEAKTPPVSPEAHPVADRLGELTGPEVERVLQRAIELQDEAAGPAAETAMSAEALARIAEELDIDEEHLRRALAEERLRVPRGKPGWTDRLIAPRSITAHGVVAGGAAEVRQVVDAWMTSHEGMSKRGENEAITTWEPDRSFMATLLHAFSSSRGPGTLRRARKVTTSVRAATDDQQVVVVEAATGTVRHVAVGLLAIALATGALVTGVSAAVDSVGFGAGNVAAGVGTFAALGAGALLAVRMWVGRMGDAVARVVDAVASPHLVAGSSLPFGLGRIFGRSGGP